MNFEAILSALGDVDRSCNVHIAYRDSTRHNIMPNTHRRRRRDSTVELRRVGDLALAVCTWIRN